MSPPSRLPAILGLVLATAIWGSTFLVTKDALDTMSVGNFLLWRFGIGAVILLAVAPRRWLGLSRQDVAEGSSLGCSSVADSSLKPPGSSRPQRQSPGS